MGSQAPYDPAATDALIAQSLAALQQQPVANTPEERLAAYRRQVEEMERKKAEADAAAVAAAGGGQRQGFLAGLLSRFFGGTEAKTLAGPEATMPMTPEQQQEEELRRRQRFAQPGQ